MWDGDPALRDRVLELLRKHEEDQEAEVSSVHVAAEPSTSDSDVEMLLAKLKPEEAGERIGAYKLLEQIGEGGFGTVWMAEQERPVRRRVALKIIKVGMDTRQFIARFEQERQALAVMDHPNIAKVFDAGATPYGRPFFVMELVRGISITEYCDEARLTTCQRLELFIRVCHAVQHAHQKGIIHRDLKPSNVLVTLHDGVPVPKVIDFGLAKATQQRLTEMTLFTAFEQMIGTPLYMSPEQAEMSGLDVDTRSDIYALGILLYELLTGRTPLDAVEFRKHSFDEMRRAIREEEPAWPSLALRTMAPDTLTKVARFRESESPKLVHSVDGDLDWIVMKALEKDRTRRYDTAIGLAADVQRHLHSEPVLARPPTKAYRLQKLFRRHRGAFTAAILILVTLLAGITISLLQAIRATRAEQRALGLQEKESGLRTISERESAAARLNEYVADIALAAQSFADGNYRRGVLLLEKHRNPSGERDLRGFEWHYLWRLAQGDEHFALPNQGSSVQSLAYSPRGDVLAIGLPEKLNVWSVRTNSLATTLTRTPGSSGSSRLGERGAMPRGRASTAGAFFPSGKSIVMAGPSAVRVWSTDTWTEQTTLPQSSGPFVLSEDGTLLAALKQDRQRQGSITLWDAATWAEIRTFPRASNPMAFAPDAKTLAVTTTAGISLIPLGSAGGELTLQDSANPASRRGPGSLTERTLAFSPDGKFIVAARNTPSERGVFVITIWDAQTGSQVATLPAHPQHIEHTGVISALAFSPDGRTLATGSLDHSIRLWDFARRERIGTLHGHLTEVWALAFSPDGKTLVSGGKDGGVKLWPVNQKEKPDVLASASMPLAFTKEGDAFLAQVENDALGVIDVATGEVLRQLPFESRRPRGPGAMPAVSADGRFVAQAGEKLLIQDTSTGAVNTLDWSVRPGEVLALSPDGKVLITGSRDEAPRWWTLPDGKSSEWRVEAGRAQFSPDGKTIAAYQRGPTIQLWDVATRALRTTVEREGEFGNVGAFSRDGRFFAYPGPEDTILLWDAYSGKQVGQFAGHKQPVLSIAFSPDGRTLASSSEDSTMRLWNIATQQELLVDRRLGGSLANLLFSPDGSLLIGSGRGRNGSLQIYRAAGAGERVDPASQAAQVVR